MTCNPFTSAASKYSVSAVDTGSLRLLAESSAIDFESSVVNRFSAEKLKEATKCINDLFRANDLSGFATLREKMQQSPINETELAEYLEQQNIAPDAITLLCQNEKGKKGKVKAPNTIVRAEVVDYPESAEPGIYTKVPTKVDSEPVNITGNLKGDIRTNGLFSGTITDTKEQIPPFDRYEVSGYGTGIENMSGTFRIDGVVDKLDGEIIGIEGNIFGGTYGSGYMVGNAFFSAKNRGSGATFNVVIANNGVPIVTVANPGSGYSPGTSVVLDDLGITVRVVDVVDILDLTPFVPGTNNRAPVQDVGSLIADFDIFLNDNYGSSITSGNCGSSFLSFILQAFNIFNSFDQYDIQLPSLDDIWGSITSFIGGFITSALSGIVSSLTSIVDNLIGRGLETVTGIKSNLGNVGQAVVSIGKRIGDVEKFYSEANAGNIKGLIENLVNKLTSQFENLTANIISWILTRFCQLSDFLSRFLQNPIKELTSLLTNATNSNSILTNMSNMSLLGAVDAGLVKVDRQQLLGQVNAAAKRSNAAGKTGSSTSSGYASRITAFPITASDEAAVIQNVSEGGWGGFFSFAGSVTSNDIGADGQDYKGAGWRVIVDQNPVLFAKLKLICESIGQSFTVNSAYRHPKYHAQNGINSSKNSQHCKANALDVRMSQSQAVEFVPIASANGFNGIAYYPGSGFLHIDLAPHRTSVGSRSWNNGSLSGRLAEVISNHERNKYTR